MKKFTVYKVAAGMLAMVIVLCLALTACGTKPVKRIDTVDVEWDQNGDVLNITLKMPVTHDNKIVSQMLSDTRDTSKQGSAQFTLTKKNGEDPVSYGQVFITDESGETAPGNGTDVSPEDIGASLDVFGLLETFFKNPPKTFSTPEDLLGMVGLKDIAKSPDMTLFTSHNKQPNSLQTSLCVTVTDLSDFAMGDDPVCRACALFWGAKASNEEEDPLDVHLIAYLDVLTSTEDEAETFIKTFYGNFPVMLTKRPYIIPRDRLSDPPEGLTGTLVFDVEIVGDSPFTFKTFGAKNPAGAFIDIYEDGYYRVGAILNLCNTPTAKGDSGEATQ